YPGVHEDRLTVPVRYDTEVSIDLDGPFVGISQIVPRRIERRARNLSSAEDVFVADPRVAERDHLGEDLIDNVLRRRPGRGASRRGSFRKPDLARFFDQAGKLVQDILLSGLPVPRRDHV